MTHIDQMNAVVVERAGGAPEQRVIAAPVHGPGMALVRIAASGVNPLDLKIRNGVAPHARQTLPAILGMDLAGTVLAVGPGVTSCKPGDEVYGLTGGVGGLQGSLALFAAVDADLLARKPANLSMTEAAALPLVFITAWEGLVDRANVQPGQKVLVQGAGGVGQQAIQIAIAKGAEVFATHTGNKRDLIGQLGATPIDIRDQTMPEYVDRHSGGVGFDIVYDTVGGTVLDASFNAVRRFGHVVSCLGWGTHALAPLSFRAATYSGVFTLLPMLTGEDRAHHGEIMREATKLVEAGKVRPLIDPRRFDLASVAEAYRTIESGEAEGKVVIQIDH